MPEDEPKAETGAEIFTALQSYYADVAAMNAAIGSEWKRSNYQGLRMGAASSLLSRHRGAKL